MLIKVTNYCSMGCSHCMENSTVAGIHMTREIFLKALDLTKRLEGLAWESGIPPFILLSGGECTEHPEIISLIEEVVRRNWIPIIISNGMWLDNPELRESILRPEWTHISIQVTNDERYYPNKPKYLSNDKRITYVPKLTQMLPLGRFKFKKASKDTPMKKAPTSFNLRSVTRQVGDVCQALLIHRARALTGFSGHCSPSISSDGTLVAGETNSCFPIGTVNSTAVEVTKALINMVCNKCGLVDNLTQIQKIAIGESRIYSP